MSGLSEKALRRMLLERLMDLKVDYACKQLFGSERKKEESGLMPE